MQVKAAVTLGYQQPFVIKDVEVAPAGEGRDISENCRHRRLPYRRRDARQPRVVPMPAILGHEGAGIVASVGEAVSGIRVGRPRGAQLRRLPPLRKLFKQPPFGLRRF